MRPTMSLRVFIDGQAGTTGLELAARLQDHAQIELLAIEDGLRKDPARRGELYEQADVVVLCLPDDAAREAVDLAPEARFLDASTAHRTSPGWVYGLPEMAPGQRQAIRAAGRVANPGCYPTGFVLSVRPLIDDGLVSADLPLRVNAVSGFSGGGRSMIAKYRDCDDAAWRYRGYGLDLNHKHVPEMRCYAKTNQAPLFTPAVGHYRCGMLVQVGFFTTELQRDAVPVDVHRSLAERYAGEPFVHVHPYNPDDFSDDGFLSPTGRNGTNHLDLMVFGNDEQVLIASRYDNLGKGAAAAAVQNLNLMLGLPETSGLCTIGANA